MSKRKLTPEQKTIIKKAVIKKANAQKSAAKKTAKEPEVKPYVPKKRKLTAAAAKALIPGDELREVEATQSGPDELMIEPEPIEVAPSEAFDQSIPDVGSPVVEMHPKKSKAERNKSKTTKVNILDPVGKEKEYLDAVRRNYKIVAGKISDDRVIYSYEVIEGLGNGDVHQVNGQGLCKGSLRTAFARLSVHLVSIDQVHKHMGLEIANIDNHHTDDITYSYHVTGFKLFKGDKVILSGYKYIPIGGNLSINTFKIPLDSNSSYQWYNELKTEIENCCEEIAKYREGNYTNAEDELPDDIHDEDQTSIAFPEYNPNPVMPPGEHPSGKLPHDPNDTSDVFGSEDQSTDKQFYDFSSGDGDGIDHSFNENI